MVRRPLFVARREAPPLLEPVDQSLHPVAFPVDGPVERSGAPFVPLARDRDPDPAPPQVGADPLAAIALVAHDALGPQPRVPAPCSISCSKAVVSWRSLGVRTNVMGFPLPSQRICPFVLNPHWLRPRASVAGSPFLPLPRAGGHE